jgi:membrane protein
VTLKNIHKKHMKNFHLKLYRKFKLYAKVTNALRKIVVPGFGGVPLFYIIGFFFSELVNESITTRASAIAFNFFIALFPGLIFLFTLIPYMPISELYNEVIIFFQEILPRDTFETIEGVLEDVFLVRRGGLLSLGIFLALFFSTNGIYSLMDAFNKNDNRSFWHKRLIALALTVGFTILLIVGFSLIVVGKLIMDFYLNQGLITEQVYHFIIFSRWLLILLMVFVGVWLLYFYASFPKRPLRLFVPGTILVTALSLLASIGFAYYVENFAQYSKFYGSLGTIIVVMLWLYFQSLILIIGYELNHSIVLGREKLNIPISRLRKLKL